MYGVLNTLSEYTHFYISKNITSYTFLLVFKTSKVFSVSLMNTDRSLASRSQDKLTNVLLYVSDAFENKTNP